MKTLPDVIIILNPKKNKEILNEALKLNIPTIGFSNGNEKIENLTYNIPGNFISLKSILFFCFLFDNFLKKNINKYA